ncbi:glucokinase [Pseudoroseomonas ludipueritiae]|uniref:Glucokinase n=1 Tax=Pseudoroseomonas ludipueritiae TaxID=198093 RepID=A0ABR7R7V8_9PROT|nr:glucokinase [Pseudoroseomonas ludipueritiae]MBC9177747.1 glucokinase [Pseudoroseomonas ludipueritiae]
MPCCARPCWAEPEKARGCRTRHATGGSAATRRCARPRRTRTWTQERFGAPPEVSQGAAGGCVLCLEAVRMFSAILGATAGDLVLTLLADGGVHVTGALCRGLGPLLDIEAMVQGFTAKGRLAGYLETVPIDRVTRPHTGLLGAALYRAG